MPLFNLNQQQLVWSQYYRPETLWPVLVVAQLLVVIYQLLIDGIHFDWLDFGLATFYVQWQAVLFWFVSRLFVVRFNLQQLTFLQALILLCIYLLLTVIFNIIVSYHFSLQSKTIDVLFVIEKTLLSVIVMGVLLYFILLQQRLGVQNQLRLKQELALLQSKIRPHFLFNTLNSIAALIPEDPQKAEALIVDFSTLIRWSIHHHEPETMIKTEWDLCEHYLSIESLRLGEKLRWRVDFSALDTSLMVPLFSLQLLIENAIYHGIQPMLTSGYIDISGKRLNNRVVLKVSNTTGGKKSDQQGHRVAIKNLQERLSKLYGDESDVKLEQKNHCFEATLIYPIREVK